MKHTTSRDLQWYLKLLIVCGAIALALYAFDGRPRDAVAVSEARFSDTSESGLVVVPASGVSETSYTATYTGTYTGSYTSASCLYPIEGGWDAYGRILYANYANRYIYFNGIYACVTNNTANTFFVPAGSYAETNSFISAGPGLGVTVVRIQ